MHVYIIGASLDGPVKIGKAANPQKRLCELQTAHHEKLHLLFHVNCGKVASIEVENRTHKAKAHLRLNGEWFRMSGQDALQAVLQSLRELGGKVSERESYEGPRSDLSFLEWLSRQEGREDHIGDIAEDVNRAGPLWPADATDISEICGAVMGRFFVESNGMQCMIHHGTVIPAVIDAWEEWSMKKAPPDLADQLME